MENLIKNNDFITDEDWYADDSVVIGLAIKYKANNSKSFLNMWRSYRRCKPLSTYKPEAKEVIINQLYF